MDVMELNDDNFETEVVECDVPVLIDFWAEWCGPCKMMSPVVDEIAKESDGAYKVCKVNVDEQPKLADMFEIQFIPTLVVMKNGEVVQSTSGVMPKEKVLEMLQ